MKFNVIKKNVQHLYVNGSMYEKNKYYKHKSFYMKTKIVYNTIIYTIEYAHLEHNHVLHLLLYILWSSIFPSSCFYTWMYELLTLTSPLQYEKHMNTIRNLGKFLQTMLYCKMMHDMILFQRNFQKSLKIIVNMLFHSG